MVVEVPTTFKAIGWLFSLGGIFVILFVPVINSIVYGLQTGEWNPLLQSTAGMIFNSDQTINANVDFLINEQMIKAHPERYDKKFVEYLKSQILTSLFFMGAWVLIVYWLLSKLARKFIGEGVLNIAIAIVIILLSILVLAISEFAYSLIAPPHKVVIPLGGIAKLIWYSPQIWAFAGTAGFFGSPTGDNIITNPIEVKDYETDKPFEQVKNPDGTDANITMLGRPKKIVEFFCQTDNDCITYFSNPNAKCQASTGVCYS